MPAPAPRTQLQLQRPSPSDASLVPGQLDGMLTNSLADFDSSSTASDASPMQRAFGGPSLDLISQPPPRNNAALAPAVQPVQRAAAGGKSTQELRIEELARYPAPPANLLQTVPYFVRVMLRRRELDEQLAALGTQRKRLETQADDALCAMGEALLAHEHDPSMKGLGDELRAVAAAREQLSSTEAASHEAREQHKAELTRIKSEIAKIEHETAPVRKREVELQTRADALKLQIKRCEGVLRSSDAELKTLRASTEPSAAARVTSLQSEREAVAAELQAQQAQLLTLQEELGGERRELAKRMGTISALREEEAAAMRTMEREQQHHRASTDGARGAHRQALLALASAAQQGRLAALTPTEHSAAVEAGERARKKAEAEEFQRAACLSFDAAAYQKGMYLLVGGTALIFLVFVRLIMF